MDGKDNGMARSLPTRYVPIGGEFTRYGVRLVCRLRPRVESPADACRGCWFSRGRKVIDGETVMLNCNDIACSSWDRMDGRNVWFVDRASIFEKVDIDG